MPTGIVKFFNEEKGFGFISTDTDGDIFVHTSNVEQAAQPALTTGQNVQFDIGEGRKGPEAINVRTVQFLSMTYVKMHVKNKLDIIAHVLTRNGITVWYTIPEQILAELKSNGYKIKKRKKFKKLLNKLDLPSVNNTYLL